MKKMIFAAIFGVMGMAGLQAQKGNFEIGPYIGAAVGDADAHNFNTGATFAYYVDLAPKWKLGGLLAVDHFFGKEYRYGNVYYKQDATFIPIAASAKFQINEKLFAGLDLGYAIGVSDGAGDGGFLARPRFGFSLPIVDLYGYYKAINYKWDGPGGPGDHHWDDKHNLGSVGVGAAFKL